MGKRAWLGVSVALAVWAPATAEAADLKAAQSMIERTYRAYCGGCRVDFDRQAKRLFSPRLWALVLRDRRLTPAGDVGALDGDPICDCQDFAITAVTVAVKPAGAPDRAQAIVGFRNFRDKQTVRLDLVATPDGWRVDNIHSMSTPDLAAFLQQHAGGR